MGDVGLGIADWGLRMGVADWGLQIGDCRLGIADWGLRIGDLMRHRAWGMEHRVKLRIAKLEKQKYLISDF